MKTDEVGTRFKYNYSELDGIQSHNIVRYVNNATIMLKSVIVYPIFKSIKTHDNLW